MPNKLTTEQFISKANKVHNNFYDYSFVDYCDAKTSIKIICPIHGIFEQNAGNHLYGDMCPKCARTIRGNKRKHTLKEFIDKGNKVHNNKYDYSLVDYKSSLIKVQIICPIHGIFETTPGNHLRGKSCPYCGGTKQSNTQEFIIKSKKVHGDRYDYSKTNYKDWKTKVIIICTEHGEFLQTPNKHLLGQGCPICKNSKGENKIIQILNEHNITFERQKRFEECRNIFILPFDFYIPEQNTCIEFDGEQHFHPVRFGNMSIQKSKHCFQQNQINDSIKNNFCKENNIRIIRISYQDDIESSLSSLLNNVVTHC